MSAFRYPNESPEYRKARDALLKDEQELVDRTKAEEGDLVRLLSRTGEALMQIAYLKNSNPNAAEIARAAAEAMFREPVR